MVWFLLFVATALGAPNTLAVLYFENQGNPDLEPLKVGLAQMLVTDLQGTVPDVTVVERVQLQKVLDELELGHAGKVDPTTANRVGSLLGARWMLMGSYFEVMGTLRIDTRLVEVETSRIVFSAGANDEPGRFMELEAELAAEVRAALEQAASDAPRSKPAPRQRRTQEPSPSGVPSKAAPRKAPSPLPQQQKRAKALEAALDFSQGLIHLDRREPERARESFQAAVAAEPALQAAQDALKQLADL